MIGSRRKTEVRLTEFVMRKFMYMKTKHQAQNVTGTDVGGPRINLQEETSNDGHMRTING